MTAMLSCDGCGAIVSERPDEDDPTARWWCLTVGPTIGGSMLLPTISFDVDTEPDEEPQTFPPIEPPRHFCELACLGAWLSRREEPAP